MRHPALDLAIDDQRVDQPTAVMHNQIFQQPDRAGFRVDLKLDAVRTIGIGRRFGLEVFHRLKPRIYSPGQRIARRPGHRMGDLGQRNRHFLDSLDPRKATGKLKVLLGRLQNVGGDLKRLFAHPFRGQMDRRAGIDRLAAGEGALAGGHGGGITGHDHHIGDIDSELFGDDLRHGGVQALPHGCGAGVDGDLAGRADPHQPGFIWPAPGRFDVVCDGDAEVATLGSRGNFTRRKSLIINVFQDVFLTLREVTAVINDARPGLCLDRVGIRLRRLISSRPIATRSAARSSIRSMVKAPWGWPAPRSDVTGTLLLWATRTSILYEGTTYGPRTVVAELKGMLAPRAV